MQKTDGQLLSEYADRGSEAAFTEIVSRHMDLVYSAALRQVGAADLAQDVAQNVFADLARKAASVVRKAGPDISLISWLYRSTRFEALASLRTEHRRLARETQAMQDSNSGPENSPDWECIRPALDEAMSELKEGDRAALLMRFFALRVAS